ncbi:histone deacetylase family protein [Bosea sp. (in: a-proteobacteria)]|uniref:histone deacetylase family protein n=1 Tax=Bosea sp. (in: a-proteobacteria) TaxID=1871050 RepID=UPI00262B4E45|nr:histone deacetylase family protein [Bosea sp. (in: a-proteobacteria)]MCO5090701.1 histone deacetylase family protein [Bosea sp. (in: a-proteobacteria)]
MTTLLITHPAGLLHAALPGHPERPDRLRAVEQALEAERFAPLVRLEAPRGTLEQIGLCHPLPHAQAILDAAPQQGFVALDADTAMSPGTVEAALRAVGGTVAAVDEVMAGRARNAFVAMRPPGHHAERERAMGFCFFNQAAIAARHAQRAHGAKRVAIVDWDVHHGNGTQDIFWDDASVLYASVHEMPLYPGTGAASERGSAGTIVNAPLHAGDGSDEFRDAFENTILPRLDAFAPDLVVISAGFDAHWRDPLASLNLREADFAWATQKLMEAADRHAGGRIVSVLEGGYDLEALAKSTAAHVAALMEP